MQNTLHDDTSVYRMLFENAGDAIYVHTENAILAVNRKACEVLDYTEDELLSMRPNEVDAAEQRIYMPERMAKLKKNRLISFETMHRKKDGTTLPVEVAARSITWNGEPAVISICRDNTEKKYIDNIYIKAAFEWQQTFDAIKDAVFLLSPDRRILRCNKASYDLFNIPGQGELLGKHCWEIVHCMTEQHPNCPLIAMEKSKKRETSVLKSGERWLEIVADPVLDENNNITGVIHVLSDITERKQAEEMLKKSQELFSLFIRHSPIYAYIKEVTPTESRVLQASDNFQQMIGVPGSDMPGKTMTELFPPDMAAKIIADDWAVVSSGEVLKLDEDLNGRNYSTIKFPIVHGDKTMLAGYTIDITDRKQAEMKIKRQQEQLEEMVAERTSALRESENKYRELVESANSIILRMDKLGKVTFFNEFAQSFFGFTAEEIIGKNVVETIVPDKDTSGQDLREMILNIGRHPEKFRNNVNENMRKNGELVWIAWSNKPIFDKSGRISEIMCVGNDITGRVKAERELGKYRNRLEELVEERTKALRESREYLQVVLDSATDAIVVEDPVSGQILDVNRRMCEMYGYTYDEALRTPIGDLSQGSPPYSQAEALAWHEKVRKFGPQTFEWLAKRSNGELFWAEVSIRFTTIGASERIVVTVHDITERKQAEAEKAKLEEENRQLQKAESLDRMAGAVAHRFNNQLQVVMGYLEMVIGNMPPDDSRTVKLITALQATQKASDVSGLMLAYIGQKAAKAESFDLSEICRKSLPDLQTRKPGNVTIETDLPSPGPVISADAKQIQQLLSNLVINACEASGEKGGGVRVNVRMVTASDIPSAHRFPAGWRLLGQEYACLEVKDSGCGIQEKDIENIFDPFFSTKFTGRGLGLSVVLGIVRAHDLVITVESGIGDGSKFKVFFPLSAQTEEICRNDHAGETPKIVHDGTVLLVEDEENVRKMTGIALVDMGFKVIEAGDGVEAVEIFRRRKDEISCLLCDLTMPRMGGWETISALRAIRRELPAVLASGYDEASVMAGEHHELPDFFLTKPYNIKKLGDSIRLAIALQK
ncbi:MAG: PAS domain S-box protein [Victivallales bacterium]|jgi:PAS domain S-box-containing protein